MNKSISISNPDQLASLIIEPRAGKKIGGVLNLSIFSSANYIDVSGNDFVDFGILPENLVTLNCSKNIITNIPSSFSVSDKLLNFNLQENLLTELDIERILSAFIDKDVSGITPQPIIDISKFGNAVPNTVSLVYITTLENNGWNVKYNPGEYGLSTDVVSSISEGESFVISLDRAISDIEDGTLVPYTITGIQADDIVEPLTGNFTVNNNTASLTFNIESDIGVDKYAEGETFTMTLDSPNAVTSIDIPIVDTTPEPYALTAVSSEDEGQTFNITISTVGTNVTNGTTVPYTITGIQADDITESLTGIFTINNNTDSITINVVANSPGDENETMVITLDDYPTSASIIIHDGPEPFNYASTDGVDDKMVINFSTPIDISSVSVDHRGDESSGPFTSGALGISFNSGSIAEGGFVVGSLGSGSYSNSNVWVTTEVVQTITTLNSITVGFADTGSPTYISRDYSNLVVKDTLGNIIVNLPLNEQATGSLDGVTAIDSSGNGYDGTYTGCTGGSYTP
jgi:hypothetical protein